MSNSPITSPYICAVLSLDFDAQSEVNLYDKNSKNVYIINTTASSNIVGHWLLLFAARNCCIFFDTYGQSAENFGGNILELTKLISIKSGASVTWNSKCLQQKNSCVCGIYCILFSYYLCQNYSMSNILSWFSDDKKLNDHSVYKWWTNRADFGLTAAQMLQCKKL